MIEANLQHLARDKVYEVEKPYSAEFEPENQAGAQRSNYVIRDQLTSVHAILPEDGFDIDINGFCVVRAKTHLPVDEALENPDRVEQAYSTEVAQLLHKVFPFYRRLECIEFAVRVRDLRFPSDQLAKVTHQQPARLAHSDYSSRGAILQLKASFPGQEEFFEDSDFDMINVWRPLIGPNNDWPLAVCDYLSIDPVRDIIAGDQLYDDRVGENSLLYHSDQHRWYYIPDHQPQDLLVFRNIDSRNKRARAFHCAFFNPNNNGPPRQSCELRFVAFR